ncbi:hypothetical protein ACJZ2D_016513 [Fusarium nematophilum]
MEEERIQVSLNDEAIPLSRAYQNNPTQTLRLLSKSLLAVSPEQHLLFTLFFLFHFSIRSDRSKCPNSLFAVRKACLASKSPSVEHHFHNKGIKALTALASVAEDWKSVGSRISDLPHQSSDYLLEAIEDVPGSRDFNHYQYQAEGIRAGGSPSRVSFSGLYSRYDSNRPDNKKKRDPDEEVWNSLWLGMVDDQGIAQLGTIIDGATD